MKYLISLYMVTFISLISCSDDSFSLPGDTVNISVSDPGFDSGIRTRTSINGSTASFTAGDAIGVFETLTGRNNTAFSYNGTTWSTSTPLYWYNGSSVHSFYAYYPYNASSQGLSAALPILSKQRVSTVPDASCDMLVTPTAITQARSSGTAVSLTMKHAFTLLRFDIKMSILNLINPYSLDSLLVRGGNTTGGNAPYGMFNTVNQISSVNYNLSSNTIQMPVNNNNTCTQILRTAPPSVSILYKAISVYVLVLPGTYTNPAPAIRLNLTTLNLLPQQTDYLPLPNYTTFIAGNMYTYQVSIGLKLFGSTKAEILENGHSRLLPAVIEEYFP